MEQIASKFRQLTRTVQRVLVNQVRNIVLTVAMLFGMQIQHKLRQCAVHASNLPFHYHKAGTSQLNCGCKVEARVHFTQRHMVTNFKVKLTRGAPCLLYTSRANLAKTMLYAINGGVDEKLKMQVGPKSEPIKGDVLNYDEVMERMDHFMDWLAKQYITAPVSYTHLDVYKRQVM